MIEFDPATLKIAALSFLCGVVFVVILQASYLREIVELQRDIVKMLKLRRGE